MADLPVALDAPLADRLSRALDVEGKIVHALEALGPVAGRDVVVVDGGTGRRAQELVERGARVRAVERIADADEWPAESVDAVVAWWSAFRGIVPAEIAAVDRLLRLSGRLLVVHDYGRDDVSRLRGDRPEYGSWGRREGPFLTAGFRMRVLHCWWTFDSINDARDFLEAAFGATGREVGADLKRPRLSYNVAIYHRTRGGVVAPD